MVQLSVALKCAFNRNRELARSMGDPSDLTALENAGIKRSLSGLVTSTSTGTNVITSPRYIAPYKQVIVCFKLPPVLCHQLFLCASFLRADGNSVAGLRHGQPGHA